MAYSIMAVIGRRNHHRDHLALNAGEWRGAAHQMAVKLVMPHHRLGIVTVNTDDVVHTTPRLAIAIIKLAQLVGGFEFGDIRNEGHIYYVGLSIVNVFCITFKLVHRFVKVNEFYPPFPSANLLHFRGPPAIL